MRVQRANLKSRRDDNEKHLVQYIEELGGRVLYLAPGQGADLVVFFHHYPDIVEVKPKKGKESHLTDKELDLQQICKERRIPYSVLTTREDVQRLYEGHYHNRSDRHND